MLSNTEVLPTEHLTMYTTRPGIVYAESKFAFFYPIYFAYKNEWAHSCVYFYFYCNKGAFAIFIDVHWLTRKQLVGPHKLLVQSF